MKLEDIKATVENVFPKAKVEIRHKWKVFWVELTAHEVSLEIKDNTVYPQYQYEPIYIYLKYTFDNEAELTSILLAIKEALNLSFKNAIAKAQYDIELIQQTKQLLEIL